MIGTAIAIILFGLAPLLFGLAFITMHERLVRVERLVISLLPDEDDQ